MKNYFNILKQIENNEIVKLSKNEYTLLQNNGEKEYRKGKREQDFGENFLVCDNCLDCLELGLQDFVELGLYDSSIGYDLEESSCFKQFVDCQSDYTSLDYEDNDTGFDIPKRK